MKKLLFYFLILCSNSIVAQNGTTFEVEKLSKPEKLLPLFSSDNIYKWLILSDTESFPKNTDKEIKDSPFNIVAKSESPDSLVYFKYNAFFQGMYRAYAEHRPFVLSPDMIWLLISQGFAQHVNANQEAMRKYFVDFSGKLSLIAKADKELNDPTLSWEEIFPQFTEQINKHVGNKLVETLTCNFSTTTPLERIASEITIMETVKSYFEFIVMYIACGIPEITLEGTPADWEKVLNKTKALKEYKLDWWISELEPLLEEFVKASKGEVNQEFWRNMFKYHSEKTCGAPVTIDGWIIKFFPYDKEGKRNNLKQIIGRDKLPNEIVKVDIKFQEVYKDTVIEIPLELWSGFIGLKQNNENFALRPQIGWMVRKKDTANTGVIDKLKADAKTEGLGRGIAIRVKEFPSALLEIEEIKSLDISFIDEINIPDELSKVKIGKMVLSGKITEEGIQRIKSLFPNTNLKINGKNLNETSPRNHSIGKGIISILYE